MIQAHNPGCVTSAFSFADPSSLIYNCLFGAKLEREGCLLFFFWLSVHLNSEDLGNLVKICFSFICLA